ncbi:hypothetical protein HBI62_129720 [Parastagonospora nodorum]|nr:hypothetical protein HBH46_073050 [Parastagonospora nodorum]KAH4158604.1 hypothetical protein HBH43_191690 [Parastagonospora nodorum]KAH4600590.1 hypothetical protein HBH82_188490 [Parastagonospora nodorum]KAH4672089.1 hypothetical protein HBH78_176830 [Parastagonospora nodorum]KAH4696912.1 hypothetical protein HBH67_187380 [Parastagonospora nodorum]
MPGKEDTYHWALMLGPKDEPEDGGKGMRYHAKEQMMGPGVSVWRFEERETSLSPTAMLLVRIMIAKVEKRDRFLSIVRNTPIREGVPGWNCVGWVQEALQSLEADGKALGSGVVDWIKVRNAAMEYCQRKRDAHRFDGQGNFNMQKTPTFDLIEGKETIP